MKKNFFNLQRFAAGKVSLTEGNDKYFNQKNNQIIYALAGNDYVTNWYSDGSDVHYYNNITVYGGAGADTIEGDSAKNLKFYGDAGDDSFTSYTSNKVSMFGGAGIDNFYSSLNKNIYISGDAGDDTFYASGDEKITLSGGKGNDFIEVYGSKNVSVAGGAGKDQITFGDNADFKSKNVIVSAGDGNDTIWGGSNDNATITAGKGNDSIYLYEGSKNNLIKYASGNGNDTIFGFDSNDTLQITSGSHSTTKSGTDFIVTVGKQNIILRNAVENDYDKIHIKNSSGEVAVYNDWTTRKELKSFIVNSANKVKISANNITNYGDQVSISGSKGDDIISNYGNKTTIVGGAGADHVSNYGDNVTFDGGKGNDNITNYGGDKVSINGGAGNDYLKATGFGNLYPSSTLVGGKGKDTIEIYGNTHTTVVYNTGDGKDTIVGFTENDTLIIDGKVKTDFYTEKNRYGDFTLKVGKGSIFFKGGVAAVAESSSSSNISELFSENNFVSSDNLSSITENNFSSVSEFEIQNFEKLSQENLITYS